MTYTYPMNTRSTASITPRINLKFGFGSDIPRFWFEGDVFKTRLFDADSVLTPCAERFFINSIRDFRDQITDPQLAEAARAFVQQEGQHSRQHTEANQRLKDTGIDIGAIERGYAAFDAKLRRWVSPRFAMAITAAQEYLTAVSARAFMSYPDHLRNADPRIFALVAWHAVEEFEHKSVAFDVMQQAAKVGYFMRIGALLFSTPLFNWRLLSTLDGMLKVDGYSRLQRLGLMIRGFRWMYSDTGLTRFEVGDFFAYFRPGFHPSEMHGAVPNYREWLAVYGRNQDPIEAGEALRNAA